MKLRLQVSVFGMIAVACAGMASAETIRQACLLSDRGVGQVRLCHCLQGAADRTLSRQDQRLAARFFRDPDYAQKLRRSDRRKDEAFWERYETFGERAEKSCSKS